MSDKICVEPLRDCSLFIDIDGVVVFHHLDEHGRGVPDQVQRPPVILGGTVEKLKEWTESGHKLFFTTARREEFRSITENLLDSLGVSYEMLVMDCGGKRILINDLKPGSCSPMAVAVNIKRNVGLAAVDLQSEIQKTAKRT